MKEAAKGDDAALELLLVALKNIIQANGGMTKIAKKKRAWAAKIYTKTVSEHCNPEFKTIASLIRALGLESRFS